MFGLSLGETAIILLVALVVIGPKELPQVIKVIVSCVNYLKGLVQDFKAQVEEVSRDAGLQDIRKELEDDVFTQMPTIIDLDGNPQPVFDISAELEERQKKRVNEAMPETPDVPQQTEGEKAQ